MEAFEYLKQYYEQWNCAAPDLHIVLGSGLSQSFTHENPPANWEHLGTLGFSDIPGFMQTTVQGHKGQFHYYKHLPSNKSFCIQVGRVHGYEGHGARVTTNPVVQVALSGTRNFVLSNAAGCLRKEWQAGDIMIINDHVNLTGKNPLIGENPKDPDGNELGPRFPDMSSAYEVSINEQIRSAFEASHLTVRDGVYLGLMGPSYETPAEIGLFSRWGMDAVGMSTVWECISLKHMGCKVGGFSFLSNLAAGISDIPLSHAEVEETASEVSRQVISAIFEFSEAFIQSES